VPAGDIKEIFAVINISYSYLVSAFQRINGEDQKPTSEQIEALFQKERARIETHVLKLVKPQDKEHIDVSWYYDAPTPNPTQASRTVALGLGDPWQLAQKYGPSAGLGALALVALTMMWRLSRRQDSGESLGVDLGLPKEAVAAAKRAASDAAGAAARRATG